LRRALGEGETLLREKRQRGVPIALDAVGRPAFIREALDRPLADRAQPRQAGARQACGLRAECREPGVDVAHRAAPPPGAPTAVGEPPPAFAASAIHASPRCPSSSARTGPPAGPVRPPPRPQALLG